MSPTEDLPPDAAPKDLDEAVRRGIVSAEQAAAIGAIATERTQTAARHEERFRFVNNFADIFICIGQIILMSSAGAMSAVIGTGPVATYGIFAAINWAMLEYFGLQNRKYAPAVVAALLFAYSATTAVLLFNGSGRITPNLPVDPTVSAVLAGTLLAAFLRARLPILLLPIALFATVAATVFGRDVLPGTPVLYLTAACGLALIGTAIWLDMHDPLRRSAANDYAFWLFVVGSPMTIHSLFVTILMNDRFDTAIWVVFGAALIAALTGLILDRRSLVVSSLAYITIALGYGTSKVSDWNLSAVALVPFVVGLAIVLLGVNWYRVRRVLMRPLAPNPLFDRLPPIS